MNLSPFTLRNRIFPFLFIILTLASSRVFGQTPLTRYPNNPILSNNWFNPDVLYDQNTHQYKMWFVSSGWTISYGTSTDGIHWTMPAGNPVIHTADGVFTPRVIRDASGYKMYFCEFNHDPSISGGSRLRLATSTDGLAWTIYGEPVLTGTAGTWDADLGMQHAAAGYDGTTYFIWYSSGSHPGIGLATSSDGIHFHKNPDNPIFAPTGSGWESLVACEPTIFYANGMFHMYYIGSATLQCCASQIGYASSPDGIHWSRDIHNPVLSPTGSGWENLSMGGSAALVDGDTLRFWYSGESAQSGLWSIGYATAPWKGSDAAVRATIRIFDSTKSVHKLTFGTDGAATAGIDTALGEEELPPVPPVGNFDARWVVEGTNGTVVNFLDTLSGADDLNSYVGRVQPGPAGYPITIAWDSLSLPLGSFTLQDRETHGTRYQIDMKGASEFQITADSLLPFEIVYGLNSTFSTSALGQWNMLSCPVTVPDRSPAAVFPGTSADVYGFDNGYFAADSLVYGQGYWVKYATARQVSIHGTPRFTDTVAVHPGWNMIGSLAVPISTLQITTVPDMMAVSSFYAYDNGYTKTTTLTPLRAYWVKVNESGSLVLSSTSSEKAAIHEGFRPNILTIGSGRASSQTLFFTSDLVSEHDAVAGEYAAPPAPPAGTFDVRYGNNSYLAALSTQHPSVPVLVRGAGNMIQIGWEITDHSPNGSYAVVDLSTGTPLVRLDGAKGNASVERSLEHGLGIRLLDGTRESTPAKFELSQNYPNPFNPQTSISFSLPHDARTLLRIYNLAGQEVATLIDKDMTRGIHSVQWDASSMPSGLYCYRLITPEFTSSKMMMYVK